MKVLYAGFDTIAVAFKGAFPPETIDLLKSARDAAAERQEAMLVKIGPGQAAILVESSGLRGGYAIRGDTGPLGEVLAFKANTNRQEWNGFAQIRASALATLGYHGARDQLFERLAQMGFVVTDHSVNRIDYAVDFLVPGFALRLDGFVAHPRTKVRPHWGVADATDPNQPSAVLTGRQLESVTVGKMPGRQIIVYDKRREVIAKRKPFWFTVWGVEPADRNASIFRIEVRAGKKELKEGWNIRTFADVETVGGDAIRHALEEVRYLAADQSDSNVTRQWLDPLWQAMIGEVERGLFDFRSGILSSKIKEVEREMAIKTYAALTLGNLAGLAVAKGLYDDEIEAGYLYDALRELVFGAINDRDGKFHRSVARARERLHFVVNDPINHARRRFL